MNPISWYLAWLRAKREDRQAIARAQREQLRAGEDQPASMSETLEEAESKFPPQP